jgi:DNA-binding NarL/FixJ family response regulator
MSRIRVLIGDVDPVDLLSTEAQLASEYEVVRAECDGLAVVNAAKQLQPDVVVLAISLRRMSGPSAAREIRSALPGVRIVFFTVHGENLFKVEAHRAGASAYVSKEAADQLPAVIGTVLQRDSDQMHIVDPPGVAPPVAFQSLTRRQQDVLQMVASGCPLKEIAATLRISPKTVEFHKYRLMALLGVRSTAELILAAAWHEFSSHRITRFQTSRH